MQMKFKVILANGISYDWEYQGTTLSIGRDPNCDLAVDDSQRRHVFWIHGRGSRLSVRPQWCETSNQRMGRTSTTNKWTGLCR